MSQTSVGGGRFVLALAIGLLVTAAASAGAWTTYVYRTAAAALFAWSKS